MSEIDKYKERIKILLGNWNAEFDQMEGMIGKASADPAVDYDGVISALRQHRYNTKLE